MDKGAYFALGLVRSLCPMLSCQWKSIRGKETRGSGNKEEEEEEEGMD